jgi:hypothetical protein
VLEGVSRFPRDAALVLQAALLAARHGFAPEAAALAALGRKISGDGTAEFRQFEILGAALERDAAVSPLHPSVPNPSPARP